MAGGVFRPGQIRAVQIARIHRISVKLFERRNTFGLLSPTTLDDRNSLLTRNRSSSTATTSSDR
jgi:hypothetical protein